MTWSKSGLIKLFINGNEQATWKKLKNMSAEANSAKIILGKNLDDNRLAPNPSKKWPGFMIQYFDFKLHDKALEKEQIQHFYKKSKFMRTQIAGLVL